MQTETLYRLIEDHLNAAAGAYPSVHQRLSDVLLALQAGVLTLGQTLTLLAKEAREREPTAPDIAALYRGVLDELYTACDP